MRILLFCPSLSLGKGGAERIATRLSTEMVSRGHKILVGYHSNGDKPAYAQHPDAILVPFSSDKPLAEYQGKIKDLNPDIIFLFYYSRDLLFFHSLLRIHDIPIGIQECSNPERITYNNWKNHSGRKGLPDWERELIASHSARIRLVMPGYELSFPPYIRQNTRAFSNSAPSVKAQARLGKEKNRADRGRIIIIGGLKSNKNIKLLIQAFALSDSAQNWEIHDFGTALDLNKRHHKEVQVLIDSLGLASHMVFHGPIDNIFPEYDTSHIHVIPSLSEGCPTAVLEAMAHGIPSIGIESCPGTNVLIQNNINGFLVKHNDNGKDLAVALNNLMSNPSLRRKLGKQAHIDSLSYRPVTTYDQWESLFQDMLAYKNNSKKLLHQQLKIDAERAMHMKRCLPKQHQHQHQEL